VTAATPVTTPSPPGTQCRRHVRGASGRGDQVCQMVYFQTKNPNVGKFWKDLKWKMYIGIFYGRLVYFTTIWYILWPFGLFFGYLVYFSRFGMLHLGVNVTIIDNIRPKNERFSEKQCCDKILA
jgi:hypothetical protein